MSFRTTLEADLEVHRKYQGKTSQRGFVLELFLRSLNPYFAPVLLCRIAQQIATTKFSKFAVVASKVNYFVFGIEIARQTRIGPGLFFPHTRGTVIGASEIGANAVIYHGVTLGARTIDVGFNRDTRPTLGDDVIVGAGATILGPVRIGNRSRIGAQTLVTKSVPDDTIARAPQPTFEVLE